MAMAAGVPIVPIVIRNAEVIAPRDSQTMNPGTVDVVVYPPLSVEGWTHDNLVDRIAEVRQLYLDTLKNWPYDEVPVPDLYRRAAQKAPDGKPPPSKAAAKKAAPKKLRPRRLRPTRLRPKRPHRKLRRIRPRIRLGTNDSRRSSDRLQRDR